MLWFLQILILMGLGMDEYTRLPISKARNVVLSEEVSSLYSPLRSRGCRGAHLLPKTPLQHHLLWRCCGINPSDNPVLPRQVVSSDRWDACRNPAPRWPASACDIESLGGYSRGPGALWFIDIVLRGREKLDGSNYKKRGWGRTQKLWRAVDPEKGGSVT